MCRYFKINADICQIYNELNYLRLLLHLYNGMRCECAKYVDGSPFSTKQRESNGFPEDERKTLIRFKVIGLRVLAYVLHDLFHLACLCFKRCVFTHHVITDINRKIIHLRPKCVPLAYCMFCNSIYSIDSLFLAKTKKKIREKKAQTRKNSNSLQRHACIGIFVVFRFSAIIVLWAKQSAKHR